MTFAEIIKKRRQDLNLTLRDVAEGIGVSEATVQRYEAGVIVSPKRKVISKLATVLKVSPTYLMGWEDENGEAIELKSDEKISGISAETNGYIEQLPPAAIEELNKYVKLLAQAYLKE
jgi:transcriptional regulator with XRE-family HTH domain